MEKVNWKVGGMSCSNCVLTINKYLEKKGLQHVRVNLIGGDVSFDLEEKDSKPELIKGIESLGYQVEAPELASRAARRKWRPNHLQYFLFCLVFTIPLLLHMLRGPLHAEWLMNPWVQFALCLPVYLTGMSYFGKSAWISIRNGMPNMNVLIVIGATAAFAYSLTGTLMHGGERYLFYETAAAIITLIFLGNYVEDLTIQSTQRALTSLVRSQKVMANMIAFDDQHQELVFPVENTQLRSGDIILVKSGDQVPADCKILWGDASVNEAIITGESMPVEKHAKDLLLGGSVFVDGTVKAQVTAASADSVLSGIINLVKQAQGEKPPVQQLADKISAVFVPVVLVISALTFIVNYAVLHELTPSLMRAIAVLVIACPCAMGLATPAAVAVGLGRAAKKGILFRNAKSLELFKDIGQVVFDKTGTLTTGTFIIREMKVTAGDLDEETFKKIVYSLEKYSSHPIARSIAAAWKTKQPLAWNKIDEIKGAGMRAETKEGLIYAAGSYQSVSRITQERDHNVYITRNNQLIGWIDMKDEVRPEAKTVVDYFKNKNIRTVLLSGDREAACVQLASELGIDEVIADQTPQQKSDQIALLNAKVPTAMIGDGINDAPALAKATIGISMSDASQIAMQTADVVLMGNGLKNLPAALGLGRHTFITIKQNLFWAFFYNVVAIPVAAFGLLSPAAGALVMGLSDVVLAANSVRLFIKKTY